MITAIYIGTEKLDLFGDENITVQSSILSSQDITSNSGDFTKDFSVPATENNNNIFKHYYNANIDNTFDARTKVDGRIELDGLPFKRGKFSLRKVIVKSGNPSSYSVYFSGNNASIKSKVGNDELKDLDLSAYNHTFNSDNVKLGLENSLFSGDLVYNLLVKKQYFYSSDPTNQTNTEQLVNIAYNTPTQDNGILWSDLRPAIKLNSIINAIETKYSFNFTGNFFNREEFDRLYLWVNPNTTNNIGTVSQKVDFDGGDNTNVDFTTDIGSFTAQNTAASNDRITWTLYFRVIPESGFENATYRIKYYIDNQLVTNQEFTGEQFITRNLQFDGGSKTFKVYFEIETNQNFSYNCRFAQHKFDTGSILPQPTIYLTTASTNTIISTVNVSNNMPKLKIIDFLRGLFRMFKLVIIPLSDTEIYVNDLKSYYAEGNLLDLTKYIDFESVDINRGKILKEINFNFEEPNTILNDQFNKNTGVAYGDLELKLEDINGDPLDGENLDYEVPFEQIIYERLNDLEQGDTTNIMYGAIINEDLSPESPKAHVFYNVNTQIGSNKIAFIDDQGIINQDIININTASHTIDFQQMQFSTVFGREFNEWNSNSIENTLYTNYHSDYITSIFNIKRRDFKFKAILPLNIITSIQLNDVIKIKGDYYRIDNTQLGLLDGKSTLNLINSFDNNLQGFTGSQTVFITDYAAQRLSTYVANETSFTYSKFNQGYGTAWVTISNSESNIYFDLLQNDTGLDRNIVIKVEDALKTKEFFVYITQYKSILTWDNNTVTWDNNIITWDNN
jgi:hypothetical protein